MQGKFSWSLKVGNSAVSSVGISITIMTNKLKRNSKYYTASDVRVYLWTKTSMQ